jgi:hypothetical protein
MTALERRQYAVALRLPQSGDAELDAMIIASRIAETATRLVQALVQADPSKAAQAPGQFTKMLPMASQMEATVLKQALAGKLILPVPVSRSEYAAAA